MKNHPIPVCLLLIFFSLSSIAQEDPAYTLQLRSGKVLPERNLTTEKIGQFYSQLQKVNGKSFAVMQFDRTPSEIERRNLSAAGIELLSYIPDRAYSVSISSELNFSVLQAAGARSVFKLTPEQKMHHALAKSVFPSWAIKTPGMVDVWISFPESVSFGELSQLLRESRIEITSDDYKDFHIVALRIPRNRLFEIAALPFVEYMEPAPHGDQPLNIESRSGARVNVLNAPLVAGGFNLKGEGVTIGVGDNSDIHYHVDFTKRNINRAAIGHNYHGTHVSGTLGAGGIRMEEYRGFAPKSTIISQSFSGIVKYASSYIADYNMVLTNNSYGDVMGDCSYMGYYDLLSRILDQQATAYINLQQVFAAGNDGSLACAPYPAGFGTVLSGFQSAKNVITVGSVQKDKLISSFSGRGPVKDGRIKPEIMSTGSSLISTIPWDVHGPSSGTSMATPGVTGGAALLYQYYRQQNGGADPMNGLIKTLLCNGADDLGNPGPDYRFGFGNMNLARSIDMLQNTRYFISSVNSGMNNTHNISVPANMAQLKVMLYWNDPAASVYAAPTLTNDLDLELTTPAPAIVLPLVLDTLPANVNNDAVNGADHINNIEQVVISNPASGNYTITVKGTTVTMNPPQQYFVVYDFVPFSTKLTYPVGGEAFNPGETVTIEWDAYGDPANTFTLEYSLNNGSSWTTINSTIPSTQRYFNWTVPNVQTDQALIRLTKNGTAQVSTSQQVIILGIPTISVAATQCQGYFAFQWTAVTGATDYEVFQLVGDEMVPLTVTASTNYTLSGLNKDSVYWVSVRARINTKPGRRAIAQSRLPNSGTCAGSISDNDLMLDSIISPNSGRLLTSTALTSTTEITARIKNLDDASVTSFRMRYSLDGGGSWIEEVVNTAVAGGATYTHTFITTADLSATGTYELSVEVINLSGSDPEAGNNLVVRNIKQLPNTALNLATVFLDDLESAASQEHLNPYTGLDGIDRYDFSNTASWGRARTFVNSGIANSGSKAVTLDYDGNYSSGVTNYLTGTFNLSSFTTAMNDLRLDFQYKNHGQSFDPSNPNNKVWIRGNDLQPWLEAFDLFANQEAPGIFKKTASIEISDILSAGSQDFSSSFQVRWGQFGHILAADNDGGEGYTFDDIRLLEAIDDIKMISIDEPLINNCGLGNNVTVKVTLRNTSPSSKMNIPIRMVVDGGAPVIENFTGPLAPNTSTQYTFTAGADLSSPGAHTILVNVQYATDNFRENDTVSVTIINSPVITVFPHVEDFESGEGNWYTLGNNNVWQYGEPGSLKIKRAASGIKAWKTKLVGNYSDNNISYLYSPCYNIAGMTNPTLSLSLALDIEDCGIGVFCDGAYIEYSEDGISWTRLGDVGTGTNWYNRNYAGNKLWSVQDYTRWHVGTTPLPTGINTIRFRVVVESDPFVNFEGIAIDDVHVYDNTMGIYDGITMGSPVSQNITGGTSWVHFTSGGKLVASIQPNNQNPGNTDVQAYINTGPVRYDFRQYYHDRNITVKPANTTLADSVTVRYYFLDSETETLINATGCTGCTKPAMVSELGVTKYSDTDDNFENGTISDNISGTFSFLSPDWYHKIPFDKGYYVEFKTLDFSEFWLNNGGPDKQTPLPVKLVNFTAKKVNKDVLVEWKTSVEQNLDHFEIEVARGNFNFQNRRFEKIAEVAGSGNSAMGYSYSFIDTEPGKSGVRYYRLKIVDRDNTFVYSPVRSVVFNDETFWQVYPNPSDGIYHFVYQQNQDEILQLKLYDANGRLIKQLQLTGNGFVQKEVMDLRQDHIAPGVYLLMADNGNRKQSFKLVKH